MKKFIYLLSFAVLSACSNSDNGRTNEEKINPDGPKLEMNVVDFSIEDSKTKIEVINKAEEDLKSVRGRLVFIGEDGKELTTATGRRKDSPFQMAENPFVVKAMSKKVITVRNKLEAETASISIKEMSGEYN